MGTSGLASKYKTALVTGASSGLGKAFAKSLLDEGLLVYGTTRDPGQDGLNERVRWLELDGSSPEGLERFIQANTLMLREIDLLINNAGSSYFSKESPDIMQSVSDLQNLLLSTPVRLTQAALAGMRKRKRGAVVNISSLAALFPLPYMAGYSAGKAGLSGYTRSLILTERQSGVIIIDFQAGDYRTAFNRNIRQTGEKDPDMERAWMRLEANLANSPEPEQAAGDLLRALQAGKSRTLRSGGFFQRRIAPLGLRILPGALVIWAIRKYYRIG
jgi:short-subunit dehydrogenase